MKTTYPLDKTGYESLIAEQQAEIEALKREIVVLQEWRAKAFIAHPNIDIDIDAAMEAEK